jgi:hypothetical protein
MSEFFPRLALIGCLALPVTHASAAELHRPLPADSTAQNGTPQTLQSHLPPRWPLPEPVLPPATLHPDAAAGLAKVYSGTPIDVTTYHYDTMRTGWNAQETDLTPASVASGNFGQLTSLNVDGGVSAEPLLVSNFTMPNGQVHNVLVIATGHNSVYAFDAQNYALLWQVNLGTSQSSTDVGCVDILPEYGISSTPVIVRQASNAATIYVVASTEPAHLSFHTKLHALDLGTGADVIAPVEIAPKATLVGGGTISFDPQNQYNRPGLAYGNGSIYIGLGSHCDHDGGDISGWLLRYDTGLELLHAFNTIETAAASELGSLWMTGFAPAIDSHGNVFVVTGNGAYDRARRNFGQSALSLSGTLTQVNSAFTPANYVQLNDGDLDFGSGGIMLLPPAPGQAAPPLAVAIGKDATLYLLNQTKLGGLRANDAGALQAQRLATSGMGPRGGPAYYGAGPKGGRVYIQTYADVLRGFDVAVGATPSLTLGATGTSKAEHGGSLPIVSSNGVKAGTGVVWVFRRIGPGQIEAYDSNKLGAPLFTASAGGWSSTYTGRLFVTPLVANGRVYVPGAKTVAVFGLTK